MAADAARRFFGHRGTLEMAGTATQANRAASPDRDMTAPQGSPKRPPQTVIHRIGPRLSCATAAGA